MVYLRYQHDAWERKFSSLNLHLMFSKLMRQNSGGFLSIKSDTGNKQLMHPCKTHQFFIEMLTFSRVSEHESSPHLSTLWLKYPGQNVSLFCITHGFQQVFCPPLLMDAQASCGNMNLNTSCTRDPLRWICCSMRAGNQRSSRRTETVVSRTADFCRLLSIVLRVLLSNLFKLFPSESS